MKILRIIATILSGPMLLIGIIWVLQGLNILPGSFMTGQALVVEPGREAFVRCLGCTSSGYQQN